MVVNDVGSVWWDLMVVEWNEDVLGVVLVDVVVVVVENVVVDEVRLGIDFMFFVYVVILIE